MATIDVLFSWDVFDQLYLHGLHRICGNKQPGRLIFRSNKKHAKIHRFCVLPPPPSLWKITVSEVGVYFGKYGIDYDYTYYYNYLYCNWKKIPNTGEEKSYFSLMDDSTYGTLQGLCPIDEQSTKQKRKINYLFNRATGFHAVFYNGTAHRSRRMSR